MAARLSLLLKDTVATATVGRALGALLRPGDVIGLIGDLGAGKTYLTRAIAEGMGIADAVTSPTFALVQEYRGPLPLFHIDPYRLDRPEYLLDLGFEEYLERGGVVVVEWANLMEDLLPPDRLKLTLTVTLTREHDTAPRLLLAEARGARYESLLAALAASPDIAAHCIL